MYVKAIVLCHHFISLECCSVFCGRELSGGKLLGFNGGFKLGLRIPDFWKAGHNKTLVLTIRDFYESAGRWILQVANAGLVSHR